MGLSRKCKQQLSQMSVRAAESHKHKKIDQENERRRFLKKQREEENFWDEYEELRSESSSDEPISKTIPLMSPALKKIIRMGVTAGGIILMKVWEMLMEGYN